MTDEATVETDSTPFDRYSTDSTTAARPAIARIVGMEQRTEITTAGLRGRVARWVERNAEAFAAAGEAVACFSGQPVPPEVREIARAGRADAPQIAAAPAPTPRETTVGMKIATA